MTYNPAHDCAKRSNRIDIRKEARGCPPWGAPLAIQMCLRKREGWPRQRFEEISYLWLRAFRVSQSKTDDPRDERSSSLSAMGADTSQVLCFFSSGLSPLWRSRYSRLRRMAGLSDILARYGSDVSERPFCRTCGRERPLRAWQLHLGANVRASKKPAPSLRVAGGASENKW